MSFFLDDYVKDKVVIYISTKETMFNRDTISVYRTKFRKITDR